MWDRDWLDIVIVIALIAIWLLLAYLLPLHGF